MTLIATGICLIRYTTVSVLSHADTPLDRVWYSTSDAIVIEN
jgi:hypothetical protein